MNCADLIDAILAIGRVTVLSLGMFAGTLTIYLGWRLYREGVTSRSQGELTFKNLRVALTAAGPGVFLALFGSYLIWSIVSQPLVLKSRISAPANARFDSHFLPSTESQVPTLRLLPVQATATTTAAPNCAKCVITETEKRLFTGPDGLSPERVLDALTSAISAMEVSAASAKTDAEARAFRQRAAILQELRLGVAR